MSQIVIDTSKNLYYERSTFDKQNFSVEGFLEYYQTEIDRKVTGWLYPLDLMIFYFLFKNVIKDSGDVCELGVAYGKSAIALSLLKKPEENLYLYDNFAAEVTPEHAKNLVETYGDRRNLVWNVCDLLELNYEQNPFSKQLKFLHIDACHNHSYVLHDLNNFSRFISSDGIISVDDFNDAEYPGINTAISQFILSESGKDWKIFAIGNNKAYLCRKNNFYKTRNQLIDCIINTVDSIPFNFAEVMGFNIVCIGSRHPMKYEDVLSFMKNEDRNES